jgi:ketosteroid isomerase-like protein
MPGGKIVMQKDEETIARTFTRYIDTFQKLDPRQVAAYCHIPCMFLSPQGVSVMPTHADVETLLTKMMGSLKERGYARSELTNLQVSQLSETLAFVSVSRVRYQSGGQELERLGETYTLRKTSDGWKIVVAAIHDAHAVLQLATAVPSQPAVAQVQ